MLYRMIIENDKTCINLWSDTQDIMWIIIWFVY